MIELIKDMPENVIAVRMSGKVTGDDYYEVLVPAIEDKVKKHEKIRLLYQVDTDIKIPRGLFFQNVKLKKYFQKQTPSEQSHPLRFQ